MILGELSALADAVCWAGTGVTTKRLGRALRPVHVSAVLAVVSTAALVVISTATGQLDDIARTPAASLGLFALGAVLGAVGMLTFFITISIGSVGVAYAVTSGLYVFFSMIGGVLFLGDRAGSWTVVGAAAILAGLYLLNSRPAPDLHPTGAAQVRGRSGGSATRSALALATVTAVLWAIDLLASAKGLQEAGLLANGLVHQAVPAVLFGGFVAASAKTRRVRMASGDRLRLGLACLLYVGSTLSWNYALDNTDAGVTALLASTSPVFALVLAGVVLRERLSRTQGIGAAVTFAGIIAVVSSR